MLSKLTVRQRKKLIKKVLVDKQSVTSVCQEAGISRTLFYRWLKRYLKEESVAPKKPTEARISRRINNDQVEQIIFLVQRYPKWSSHKICQQLFISNHGVYNVLKRLKLNTKERRLAFAEKTTGLFAKEALKLVKEKQSNFGRRFSPQQRLAIINKVIREKQPVAQTCREENISRPAFYKWYARYQEAPKSKKLKVLKNKKPKIKRYYRQTPVEHEKKILEIVVQYPEYGVKRIVDSLPEIAGKSIVGYHGVQNVLQRLNLNTHEKRLAYAQIHKPAIKSLPAVSWTDRLKTVWDKFITGLAPAPPPLTSYAPSFSKQVLGFAKIVLLSIFLTTLLSSTFIYYIRMLSQAPTLSAKLGLISASTALLTGSLFFIYSMKYYITLAIVLSFSRHTNGQDGEEKAKELGKLGILGKVFGINISTNSNRNNGNGKSSPVLQPNLDNIKLERHPFISVHVPLYNEEEVVRRILNACTKIKYPNFEIIVCDDSTDETTAIVERFVQQWNKASKASKSVKPNIKILHRNTRQGYKGAALKNALKHMDKRTEFVVVFDADFIPYPDTLELFLKYFAANGVDLVKALNKPNKPNLANKPNSNIAAVSGYQWHVLNKSENWITRGVRSEYAGSYVIERPGREILGLLKQISGSVYMIRADVLKKIGWGTSITEDFQLTLKLYEKGYKVVYTPYIQAPAECVSTIKRLIRQRMRWAEGHSNNIRKMFKRLITSPNLTFPEKLEVLYLTPYYLQAAFFLLGTFSWLISETVFKARLPFWTSLWGWSLVLTNFFALPLVNAVGLFLEEAEEKDYAGLASFVILSYILVPFQAYASIKGFLKKEEGPWFRTPKTGRITDVFKRGKFYRWVSGILPGRIAPSMRMQANFERMNANARMNNSLISLDLPEAEGRIRSNSRYLALATANNTFKNFRIKKRHRKGFVATILIFLISFSSLIFRLAPNIPYNDIPIVLAAQLFNIGHEDNDLSEYDSTSDPDGDELNAAAAAAMGGTSYGMQIDIDDLDSIYGWKNQTAPASNEIRFRFYIDPNTVAIDGSSAFIQIMRWHLSSSPGFVFKLALYEGESSGYLLQIGWERDDSSSNKQKTSDFTDAPHYVEIHIERASSDIASDGRGRLWVDGVLEITYSIWDNYDLFPLLSYFLIGAPYSSSASNLGTIYFDEINANDDGTEIGEVPENLWVFLGIIPFVPGLLKKRRKRKIGVI